MRLAPPYSVFAAIYDSAMAEVPYQSWATEILRILQQYHIGKDEVILDIACGTGEIIRLLQPLYPRICGLDIAIPMLQHAQKKKIANLIQADMKELPLRNATAGAVICTHDAINYLENQEALTQHLQSVSTVLRDGGVYVFDCSSERNVLRNYHGREFHEKHNTTELHWSNNYDFNSRVITSKLTFQNDIHTIIEEHRQYIFSPYQIKSALAQAGLTLADEFSDYRCTPHRPTRLHCYLAYK